MVVALHDRIWSASHGVHGVMLHLDKKSIMEYLMNLWESWRYTNMIPKCLTVTLGRWICWTCAIFSKFFLGWYWKNNLSFLEKNLRPWEQKSIYWKHNLRFPWSFGPLVLWSPGPLVPKPCKYFTNKRFQLHTKLKYSRPKRFKYHATDQLHV